MTPAKPRKKTSTPTKRSPKAPAKKATAVVSEAKPQVGVPELKKKELIDLVVGKSGISKKDAKPVIEAMLEVLGATVAEGRDMNLHPLGKVKYNRIKQTDAARIVVLKLRQNKARAMAPGAVKT